MVLRSIVVLLAMVPFCSLSSSFSSDPAPRAPARPIAGDVHFEPKVRDVEALVGENVPVSFELVNAGDRAVRLTRAECKWGSLRVDTPAGASVPACRRIDGIAPPLAIAAGAHVTLVDGFDGRLACEPGSREECWVRAWIDDATEPLEATVRWRRRPLGAVRGNPIDLGEIDPRATIERRVVLAFEELGRFEVVHAGLPSDGPADPILVSALTVQGRDVTPAGADRTQYEIVARLDASKLQYGERFTSIVVSLRRARVPDVRINVHWKLAPPFELLVAGSPVVDAIALGLVKQAGVTLRPVVFHSRDPAHPVRVRGARVEARPNGQHFRVAVGAFADGETPLDLSLVETPEARVLSGELVVETDDPRAPEWRRRISGIWNGSATKPEGK